MSLSLRIRQVRPLSSDQLFGCSPSSPGPWPQEEGQAHRALGEGGHISKRREGRPAQCAGCLLLSSPVSPPALWDRGVNEGSWRDECHLIRSCSRYKPETGKACTPPFQVCCRERFWSPNGFLWPSLRACLSLPFSARSQPCTGARSLLQETLARSGSGG